MSEALTQPDDTQPTEAQALEAAQAGYDKKTRAEQPAPVQAVVESTPVEVESIEDEPVQMSTPAEPAPAPADALAEQLRAFKAEVQAMVAAGAGAETVRKMHGEIGNINRTLKQLQAPKGEAPAEDDLAAALKSAEEVAAEYPEIAGPLVKLVKAMQASQPKAETVQPTGETLPLSEPEGFVPAMDPEALRQKLAIEAINEVHPDRFAIKETPAFKQWFAAKPPEYQTLVNTTWNPAVLSQCFSDFKGMLAARKRKQDRLDGATTPQGVTATPGSSTLPDDAGFARGYAKAARRF